MEYKQTQLASECKSGLKGVQTTIKNDLTESNKAVLGANFSAPRLGLQLRGLNKWLW